MYFRASISSRKLPRWRTEPRIFRLEIPHCDSWTIYSKASLNVYHLNGPRVSREIVPLIFKPLHPELTQKDIAVFLYLLAESVEKFRHPTVPTGTIFSPKSRFNGKLRFPLAITAPLALSSPRGTLRPYEPGFTVRAVFDDSTAGNIDAPIA